MFKLRTFLVLLKVTTPIDAADKRDTDTVVEEIHEEAKTEEKENENGEKETVEISPCLLYTSRCV